MQFWHLVMLQYSLLFPLCCICITGIWTKLVYLVAFITGPCTLLHCSCTAVSLWLLYVVTWSCITALVSALVNFVAFMSSTVWFTVSLCTFVLCPIHCCSWVFACIVTWCCCNLHFWLATVALLCLVACWCICMFGLLLFWLVLLLCWWLTFASSFMTCCPCVFLYVWPLLSLVHCEVAVFTDAALSLVFDVPLIAYELGLLGAVAFKYMCITWLHSTVHFCVINLRQMLCLCAFHSLYSFASCHTILFHCCTWLLLLELWIVPW